MDEGLKGRRILVVEDSPGLAEITEQILRDFGCQVVGPTGNLAMATEHAETAGLDAAVIDVNIRGWKVFPVARILAERNVPFVLTSGYSEALPDDLAGRPHLAKPYDANGLGRALAALLDVAPPRGPAPEVNPTEQAKQQPAAATTGLGEYPGTPGGPRR